MESEKGERKGRIPISTKMYCEKNKRKQKIHWKVRLRERGREPKRERELLSTGLVYRCLKWPGVGQSKAKSSIWIFQKCGRGPNMWVILHCSS